MNKRSLQGRGADLSSRRAVEEAIQSTKDERDLTWEESAKRSAYKTQKWRRQRSLDDENKERRHG
jgi:hypothetical protein